MRASNKLIALLNVFLILLSSLFSTPLVSVSSFNSQNNFSIQPFGLNVTRREALVRYIMAFYTRSGGFKNRYDEGLANVYGTHYAVLSLKMLGELTPNLIDEVYRFILSLYDKRGFFYYDRSGVAKVLVYLSDTWDAVETLNAIGKLDDLNSSVRNSIINWVLSMYDNETSDFMGSYDPTHNEIEHSPFSISFLSGVRILQLLGALNRIDKNKTIKRIYERFYHDGHFGDIFDNVVENYYVISCLKILGGLNESIAYRDAVWLRSLINPATGVEIYGNLANTVDIVVSLNILGHLDFLPVNKTAEAILSMQSHKYGGFLSILNGEDKLDNYFEMRDTYKGIESLFLLNVSKRLDEPFYVEEIPDFSDEPGYNYTSGDESSGGECGSDLIDILRFFVVSMVIMSIISLVIVSVLYLIKKRFWSHEIEVKRSESENRKVSISYRE